jgi:hypothetical protein
MLFYLRVETERLQQYKVALPTAAMNIADFGEILASGWGDFPPESVVTDMKTRYVYETPYHCHLVKTKP